MDALKLIITILQLLCGIAIILAVLVQSGKSAGLSGAIGGGAEQLFGKKKSKGYEAVLSKISIVGAICFIICSLALVCIE